MLRTSLLLISICLLGCGEPRQWEVVYRVIQKEPGACEYRVRYVDESGAEVQNGVLSTFPFVSDTLTFEDGSDIYFSVERVSGSIQLEAQILRDGAIHASEEILEADREVELQTTL